MAATVYISESNTGSETVTDEPTLTNCNMGSNDSYNIVPATYPITANTYGFEKYWRVHLHDISTSDHVDNIRVWISATTSPDTLLTSATTTSYTEPSFAAPVSTVSSKATNAMPISDPGQTNAGIDGSLTGVLDATGEYSDYVVCQLHVDTSSTAGKSLTINFKYEEVA